MIGPRLKRDSSSSKSDPKVPFLCEMPDLSDYLYI